MAAALLVVSTVTMTAPPGARQQLAHGHQLWRLRLSRSALVAFEAAARNRATAAEAQEAIGRIYMFKGWQQEGVFPGWHDEPEYRDRAIAAFKKSLAADPSRASAAAALKQAQEFAAAPGVVPPAPPSPEVKALDAKLEAFRGAATISPEALEALLDQRANLQGDPAPYFTAAQIMLEHKEYDRATTLAERGAAAAARFIDENEGAYKMAGKTAGIRTRMRAASLDILGAVALARKDLATAARHLEEAGRITRGQDFMVEYHLGELARERRDRDGALNHYLDALALSGGPAPVRDRATEAAKDIHGASPGGSDAWLSEEIERRRADRRAAALRTPLDRPLPALNLNDLDGKSINLASFRGKVLLLNFFSSW